jgi:hypothetical protein
MILAELVAGLPNWLTLPLLICGVLGGMFLVVGVLGRFR